MSNNNVNMKKDFIWGVNGHNCNYPAYPAEKLDEQIKYAAELGVDSYRINCTPENEEMFSYLDKVVDTCDKYNLKVFLILFDKSFIDFKDYDSLYNTANTIAKRYKGRISMYQISNEQDIPALDLEKYQGPIGNVTEHYDMKKYHDILPCMQAIQKGVKDADENAETIVNVSWRHTAVLDMFINDGFLFDAAGLDWYWGLDPDGHNNIVETLEHLNSLPVKKIYVAEANQWEGDYRADEQQMAEYVEQAMDYYYNYPCEKLAGFYIYQLLDEADKEYGEGHFGLMLNDIKGNIGRKKTAYNTVADYIRKCKGNPLN